MRKPIAVALALTLLLLLVLPTTVAAKTRWDLEGWRIDAGKWMDGLLFTYYEDDLVQYRLKGFGYDGVDTEILIRHDYQDADGAYGVDWVQDFFVGNQTKRTEDMSYVTTKVFPGAYFSVDSSAPPVETSNGYELQFKFIVLDAVGLKSAVGSDDIAFYWRAHLAVTDSPPPDYGSSYWNGASLHAHTSVSGSQDVPIKTPPQEGPPPEPCIDVVKEVSVDGGVTWDDANTSPGPTFLGNPVQFKIVVTNCGETTLENIHFIDVLYKDGSQIATLSVVPNKTTLTSGESDVIYVEYTATGCVYENVVTAFGVCAESDIPVQDVDSAWFHIP